jgi:hypothetical protein
MNSKLAVATVCAIALVGGCASRAGGVAPVSINAAEYAHLDCASARAELATAREQEIALTRRQNNAAVADAAGVFLLLIPVGSVFGANVEGELAQTKGEVNALERHVAQRCAQEAGTAAAPVAAATPAAPAAAPAEPVVTPTAQPQ